MSYPEFWGAVVEQAAIDILRPEFSKPTVEERSDALDWVLTSKGMASYDWACEAAGIEPDILRRIIHERGIA